MENGFIESFNGKLHDECLNKELFFTLKDARQNLKRWHKDSSEQRPHSVLGDCRPWNASDALWKNQQLDQPKTSISSDPNGTESRSDWYRRVNPITRINPVTFPIIYFTKTGSVIGAMVEFIVATQNGIVLNAKRLSRCFNKHLRCTLKVHCI